MGMLAIAAYAQDLGILLLEPVVILPEGGGLVASTTCKVEDVEREDYMLLTFVLTQRNLVSGIRGYLKVRGRLPDFCCHLYASFGSTAT